MAAAALALLQCAACTKEHKAGDVLGDVYSADAVTLLDGVEIPSYSFDGKTVIALNDLDNYGFSVDLDEENKRMNVKTELKPSSYDTPEVKRGTAGEKCGQALYTDISAYVNGVQCPVCAFDGKIYASAETLGELTDDYNKEWGYSDYNFNYSRDVSANTLSLNAYRFPEITFVDALNENKGFADVNELELYTTGTGNSSYTASKLEPESGIYAGINADGNEDFNTEFGVYSSYFEFDLRMNDFISKYKSTLKGKDDVVYLIPWNTSDVSQVFDNDKYIKKTLDNIAAAGKKSIVRFACEMNCSDLGDSPSMYVKAFRHIADMVHQYDNLAVMWSPNDYGSFNRPYEIYYPGDEYVDWIGISCFLKHDFAGNPESSDSECLVYGCGDYAWASNSIKKIAAFMKEHNINKPIAISEGAVESRIHYADIELEEWAEPRLRAMYWYTAMKFPQVKMLTYFNVNCGGEVMEYKVTDKYADIIEEAIAGAGYKTRGSGEPSVSFIRAEEKTYTDTLPLYTYAYFPHNDITKVEYLIDGKAAAEASDMPYKSDIDLSALSQSVHTLTVNVVTSAQTFSYSFSLSYNNGWSLKAG